MLQFGRLRERERTNSRAGYWSIAITSTLILVVGVGVAEAGSEKWISTNNSAYQAPKAYSKTPSGSSAPSIDRGRLNRTLSGARAGGSSRFSIDRSRLTKRSKKAKRRYRARHRALPKAPRVVRAKRKFNKRVSRAAAAAAFKKRSRIARTNVPKYSVVRAPGLVLTLAPPNFSPRYGQELSQLGHMKEAMEASKTLLDSANLRRGVDLPFGDPLRRDDGSETDAEAANPFFGGGLSGAANMAGDDQLSGTGPGWSGFGFLANSHSRQSPATASIGVSPGSIAGAIGGVAGYDSYDRSYSGANGNLIREYTKPNGHPGGHNTVYESFYERPGFLTSFSRATNYYDGSGRLLGTAIQHFDFVEKGDQGVWVENRSRRELRQYSTEIFYGEDGEMLPNRHGGAPTSGGPQKGSGGEAPEKDKPKDDVTKLYDPESGGGSGWVPPWCVGDERCGRVSTSGILTALNRNARVLTPDPGQDSGQSMQKGPPVVSQQDLLSNYDPDSAARSGGGRPMRMEHLCHHSEC